MAIDIHPIRHHELPRAVALWHEGWIDAHVQIVPETLTRLRTYDSFLERMTRDIGSTRVATRGGRILGFSILKQDEVYQFYVAPEARGSGLATRLIADAETRLRETGVARAWLACTVGNDRAARFYEKAGWTRARTETLAVETSEGPFHLDIWRYEKSL